MKWYFLVPSPCDSEFSQAMYPKHVFLNATDRLPDISTDRRWSQHFLNTVGRNPASHCNSRKVYKKPPLVVSLPGSCKCILLMLMSLPELPGRNPNQKHPKNLPEVWLPPALASYTLHHDALFHRIGHKYLPIISISWGNIRGWRCDALHKQPHN